VRDPADCIVFTSPCEPWTRTLARVVWLADRVTAASDMLISQPEPVEYFQAADGADPDPEEVAVFLADYAEARAQSAYAYIPDTLVLHQLQRQTAEQIGLIPLHEHVIRECARITGLSPTALGLNTTTRTYTNAETERSDYLDFTMFPLVLGSIEQRLSMNDVTPRTQTVKFSLDAFLRSSTLDRYQAHSLGITAGFLTPNDARAYEDKQAMAGGDELTPNKPSPPPAAQPPADNGEPPNA
jgi:Phage portal protein